MYFYSMDSKHHCGKYYLDTGKMSLTIPQDYNRTWAPHCSIIGQDNITYGAAVARTDNLTEVCPPNLAKKWKSVNNKFFAYKRSFKEAKISLDENCVYDLLPEHFLHEYFYFVNQITKYVFDTHTKGDDYEILHKIHSLCEVIRNQRLNLDSQSLIPYLGKDPKAESLFGKIKKGADKILYNPYKVVTGRLTTEVESFPILSFKTGLRQCLKPQNDFFLELDYNAAEIRVLLGLLGAEQPQEDIHEWHLREIFDDVSSREEAKKEFFAWLYNPYSSNVSLEQFYDTTQLKNQFYKEGNIYTPFGRIIEGDDYHFLNYLLQSTSSDLLLSKAYEIFEILNTKKSFISFVMHDSIVIDMSMGEFSLIKELLQIMKVTKWGKFLVNIAWGDNYGNLKQEKF